MNTHSVLALVAATFSAALAVAAAWRGRRSLATWCFSAGMLSFALESLFGAMWLARPVYSRKSGLLGRSYTGDEVVSSGDLALL